MDKYTLPTFVKINNVKCSFKTDFRDILKLLEIFNEPNLLEEEKFVIALKYFYHTDDYLADVPTAIKSMTEFIDMAETDETPSNMPKSHSKPLYDWEQDFNIIVAPINRVLGYDVRGAEYVHWWTFLSAFMEIGECTFNTYVSIRDKLNRGKKLEKYEEKILKDNRDKIILKPRVDDTTQALLDEIMGV